MDIAALILSIIALVVSVVGTLYTRRAAQANERSAVADSTTAALELDRRHAELTPHLRVWCRPLNPKSDRLKLTVALVGPPELQRLNGLTLTIRDDRPWREQHTSIAGGPTPEQIASQIWGPLRFVPGTGPGAGPAGTPGADATGRTTPTTGLPVGEELPFILEPTLPPSWSGLTDQDWRRQRGSILKLTFELHRDGLEPWTLTAEIDTQTDNPIEVPHP